MEITTTSPAQKPKSVTLAVRLLWVTDLGFWAGDVVVISMFILSETSIILDSAVERIRVCVFSGAGQGAPATPHRAGASTLCKEEPQ